MAPPATSPTISKYRQSTHHLNSFSSHLATFFSDGQMSYHPLWSAKLVSQERQGEELGVIHMAPNLIGVPLSSLRDILIVCRPPTPHFQVFRAQTITASVAYLGDVFEQFHRRHSHQEVSSRHRLPYRSAILSTVDDIIDDILLYS
jgi:hypothetical protein